MQEVRLSGRNGVGNLLYLKGRSVRTHTLHNFFLQVAENVWVLLTTSYLLGSNTASDNRQDIEPESWKIKKFKNIKCKRKKSQEMQKKDTLYVFFSLTWNVKKMYIIFKETLAIFWAITELKRLSVNTSVKNKGYRRIQHEMSREGQKREPLV